LDIKLFISTRTPLNVIPRPTSEESPEHPSALDGTLGNGGDALPSQVNLYHAATQGSLVALLLGMTLRLVIPSRRATNPHELPPALTAEKEIPNMF
jgi:hypothetical protein